jgi:hypothetical protein
VLIPPIDPADENQLKSPALQKPKDGATKVLQQSLTHLPVKYWARLFVETQGMEDSAHGKPFVPQGKPFILQGR